MSERITLVPTDPEKVVPDLKGNRIGPEGVTVTKPMHPYYTRRVMRGDLTKQTQAPKVYAPEPMPEPQPMDDEE